jgi:hypothetical protein
VLVLAFLTKKNAGGAKPVVAGVGMFMVESALIFVLMTFWTSVESTVYDVPVTEVSTNPAQPKLLAEKFKNPVQLGTSDLS